MQNVKQLGVTLIALACLSTSCTNNDRLTDKNNTDMKQHTAASPDAASFVNSPLRNRIKLELQAPVSAVWSLIGDPARMPEYSTGLNKVDTEKDQSGKFLSYKCFFKPMGEGGSELIHTTKIAWHEPLHGWASIDEEPNAFGLKQSLTLIKLEDKGDQTILTWDMHFNCENEENLQMNISSLAQALNNDIAQNLLKKFGGKIIESYVEKTKSF